MKLRRFVALDTQRAMVMVHKKLGPDALVYSTRRVPNGVEMLAGLPADDNDLEVAVEVEKINFDKEMIDKLNLQLQVMEDSIQKLTNHIITLYQVVNENAAQKEKNTWSIFKTLARLKKQLLEGRYGRQTAHF